MNEKHRLTVGLLKLLDLAVVVFAFALSTFSIVKAEHGVSPCALPFDENQGR